MFQRWCVIIETVILVLITEAILWTGLEIAARVQTWFNLSVYYRVAITFQVALIIANIVVHAIIYRKTKLVAQGLITYGSDDVALQTASDQVQQNSNYKLGKKVTNIFSKKN